MKIKNLKLTSAFLAVAVAGGVLVGSITNANADTSYKQGTIISETVVYDEIQYNQYVVKKGDTLSKISMKVCKYFGEPVSTEYWPAIAFLNGYPKVSNPGDIIIFPSTFEDLVELNDTLREVEWTARYIQNNNVYNAKKNNTIKALLRDIYGNEVEVDDDFVNLYLKAQGLTGKYDADSTIDNYDMMFELTEWIPTTNQLNSYRKSK